MSWSEKFHQDFLPFPNMIWGRPLKPQAVVALSNTARCESFFVCRLVKEITNPPMQPLPTPSLNQKEVSWKMRWHAPVAKYSEVAKIATIEFLRRFTISICVEIKSIANRNKRIANDLAPSGESGVFNVKSMCDAAPPSFHLQHPLDYPTAVPFCRLYVVVCLAEHRATIELWKSSLNHLWKSLHRGLSGCGVWGAAVAGAPKLLAIVNEWKLFSFRFFCALPW